MVVEVAADQQRPMTGLRFFHESQKSLEKFRVAMGNRVSALARGVDTLTPRERESYEALMGLAVQMEAKLDGLIATEVCKYSVYREWLQHVKGIGPGLAGQVLSLLLPPLPNKGPSSWYKAAGLVPEHREKDGLMHLPRATAGGGKLEYHPWLRRCLWNVATSFVRNGGYYRKVYEEKKARLQVQHEGDSQWAPWRIDSVARWITVKLFLSHLWEAWCEAEDTHNRQAWIVQYGGDSHHYIPRPMPSGSGKI